MTRLPAADGRVQAVPAARRSSSADSSGPKRVETKHGWRRGADDEAAVRAPTRRSPAAFGQPSIDPARLHICQACPQARTAMLWPRPSWAWCGRLNGAMVSRG